MKKIFSAMLAAAVIFSMLVLNVGAQAENKLTKSWELGLTTRIALTEETDTDGTKYVSVTGIEKAWDSPTVDILDAVKSAAGDNLEDGADVYVAFDVRIKYAEGADTETPVTARVLLRMVHELSKDEGAFLDQYPGTLFSWMDTNIMHYFQTRLEIGSEWVHFEDYLTVDSLELEGAGTAWNLCIDTISDPTAIAALEFRNVGVYDDTYEPVEIEEPEAPEEPEEPEEPEGPTATPMPTAGQQTPFGLSTTTAPATETTPGTGDADNGNTTTIVVICVVAAVVVAAVIIGVVVAKKKKASGTDDSGETDNKTEE